ncbi:23015_t:CDS:1, partial [Dentiscutata erythropus]
LLGFEFVEYVNEFWLNFDLYVFGIFEFVQVMLVSKKELF